MSKHSNVISILDNKNLSAELLVKWHSLIEMLGSLESAVVAYSGGVDSTFLAYSAHLTLGNKMCAVLIETEVESDSMLTNADMWAEQAEFNYFKLKHQVLHDRQYTNNPVNRCYFCKVNMLKLIHNFARENGYKWVLEGQNLDDVQDYRPGQQAVTESGTLSPLREAGLTKADIRTLAFAIGLSVWDKPSSPCLASRFPYGHQITQDGLTRVMKSEEFLHQIGYSNVRVRIHDEIARIEVPSLDRESILKHAEQITDKLKSFGFKYVTLDLLGYRQGSLNEGITK